MTSKQTLVCILSDFRSNTNLKKRLLLLFKKNKNKQTANKQLNKKPSAYTKNRQQQTVL